MSKFSHILLPNMYKSFICAWDGVLFVSGGCRVWDASRPWTPAFRALTSSTRGSCQRRCRSVRPIDKRLCPKHIRDSCLLWVCSNWATGRGKGVAETKSRWTHHASRLSLGVSHLGFHSHLLFCKLRVPHSIGPTFVPCEMWLTTNSAVSIRLKWRFQQKKCRFLYQTVQIELSTQICVQTGQSLRLTRPNLKVASSRTFAFCGKSLTPVSANFWCQESAPSGYLRQTTCITLGVMSMLTAPNKSQSATSLPQLWKWIKHWGSQQNGHLITMSVAIICSTPKNEKVWSIDFLWETSTCLKILRDSNLGSGEVDTVLTGIPPWQGGEQSYFGKYFRSHRCRTHPNAVELMYQRKWKQETVLKVIESAMCKAEYAPFMQGGACPGNGHNAKQFAVGYPFQDVMYLCVPPSSTPFLQPLCARPLLAPCAPPEQTCCDAMRWDAGHPGWDASFVLLTQEGHCTTKISGCCTIAPNLFKQF